MTEKEALERFKIDLHILEMTTSEGHVTKQMEMYQIAIKALEEREDLIERAYGHVVGQGTKGVIRPDDLQG